MPRDDNPRACRSLRKAIRELTRLRDQAERPEIQRNGPEHTHEGLQAVDVRGWAQLDRTGFISHPTDE